MKKVRLLLMHQGRVEHDIEIEMMRPRLKEVITLQKPFASYKIKFIQHMFDKEGKFESLMVTGIKKI